VRIDWKLQQWLELFAGELAVAKDLEEKARPNSFTAMHWYHGHATVRVTEKMVAALDPHDLELHLNERRNDLLPREAREANHQPTVTF